VSTNENIETAELAVAALVELREALSNYSLIAGDRPSYADLGVFDMLCDLQHSEGGFDPREVMKRMYSERYYLVQAPEMWQYDQDMVIAFLIKHDFMKEEVA
jgi:hypothetical protein